MKTAGNDRGSLYGKRSPHGTPSRSGQNPLELHIGHGTFAAIVVHQLFHALASLRGQRLLVVLLQRPNHLAKSGSQHFSRELRCPDRKGNRFWFTSSCIKPPFRRGSRYPGGPRTISGNRKPRANVARGLPLGISAGRSFLFRLRLDFFVLFPHGLQDRGLL